MPTTILHQSEGCAGDPGSQCRVVQRHQTGSWLVDLTPSYQTPITDVCSLLLVPGSLYNWSHKGWSHPRAPDRSQDLAAPEVRAPLDPSGLPKYFARDTMTHDGRGHHHPLSQVRGRMERSATSTTCGYTWLHLLQSDFLESLSDLFHALATLNPRASKRSL